MKYLFLVLILAFCGCIYPKDPHQTFKKAKNTGLKVGVSVHPPFTVMNDGKLSGTEIQLIEGFAKKKNLEIEYTVASESKLIKQLENQQLYLLIGGFDKKTIWKKKAGLSTPYDEKHVILVGKGENRLLFELEGYIFQKYKD